ncbi:L-aspartate/glutamate-specific racemase [Sporomusa rhizae]|uniref:aspartate/glutamate racemase family protein n=1 Tax=Sporomusa rhizae TaxID=357999 RepID=UPI00352B543D
MKTIGLIGGVSWESSVEYYRLVNEGVKQKLGGLHSARCLMYSVDFGTVEEFMRQGNWQQVTREIVDAALRLKQGGADFIIICSNTIHKCADSIIEQTGMPLLHIADAAAQQIKEQGLQKVGLLGTKFVMEGDFYRNRLKEKHGIEVIIPETNERELINTIIFQELCMGVLNSKSKEQLQKIINKLLLLGAEGVVLGCTEIPLLIKQADVDAPVFDTMTLHAAAAVKYALE